MLSRIHLEKIGGLKKTGRTITEIDTNRQGEQPVIAIALSDVEYLMKTARSARYSTRTERTPGCDCYCHLKTLVTVFPRNAYFTTKGGLSIHNLMNRSKSRIAIKITCSDNVLYRVNPVYAVVEPEQVITLHVGRVEGVPRKDRLCVLILEYSGSGNVKEVFKRADVQPVTINVPLCVSDKE